MRHFQRYCGLLWVGLFFPSALRIAREPPGPTMLNVQLPPSHLGSSSRAEVSLPDGSTPPKLVRNPTLHVPAFFHIRDAQRSINLTTTLSVFATRA